MSGTDYELTPNFGLYKPTIDADDDMWGSHWNLNADALDTILQSQATSYLPRAGGTLTGPLTINSGTDPTLYITSTSGVWPGVILDGLGNYIGGSKSGIWRWEIDLGDGSAETGGNAGSNFGIARYDDAGNQIGDYALAISRATGLVTLAGTLNINADVAGYVGVYPTNTSTANGAFAELGATNDVPHYASFGLTGSGYVGYVDTAYFETNAGGGIQLITDAAVPISFWIGGTQIAEVTSAGMILAADPTAPLGAATKQYSDLNKTRGLVDVSTNAAAPTVAQTDYAYIYIYGSPTGPATITMPVATTVRVLWTMNNTTTQPVTIRGTSGGTITIPSGASEGVWTDTAGIYPLYNAGATRAPGDNSTFWATTAFVQTKAAGYLPLVGGTMTGPIALPADPTVALQAATKQYVDARTTASGVASFNSRTGVVTLSTADLTGALGVVRDANWNVGINVALPTGPAAGGGQLFANVLSASNQVSNFYYDGVTPAWRYLAAGQAWLISAPPTSGGAFLWDYAPAGAAGAVATLQNLMSLTTTGTLQTKAGIFAMNDGNFGLTSNATYKYLSWQSGGWTDNWRISDGLRIWGSPSGNMMTLDGSGNLGVAGAFTATGMVTGSSFMSNSGTFYVAANTAYYFGRNSSNGYWYIVNNSAAMLSLDTSGTLTATNHVIAVGNLYARNGGSIFGNGGNGVVLQFSQSWYLDWNATNGTLTYLGGGALWWADGSGNITYTGSVWANAFNLNSDRRIKRNIQPWARGLAEVIQLEPVSFEYNGEGGLHDDGVTHYGFVAQDAQACLPEAVHIMPPPSASVERIVTDQLAFDHGTLTAAMVNAIKELSARVVALEARA